MLGRLGARQFGPLIGAEEIAKSEKATKREREREREK